MTQVTIKNERTNLYVEVQVDSNTYLFSQEQYAELFRTMQEHPPKSETTSTWEQDLKDIVFAQQVGFQQMREEN